MKRFPGADMDPDPEQLLEILNQPGVIHQAPARLPRHQQIEVAILIGFTAGHGAEPAQAVGAAPLGETENLLPPLCTQSVQGDHISIVRRFRAAIILPALVRGGAAPEGEGAVVHVTNGRMPLRPQPRYDPSMKLLVTLEADETGMLVAECPAIPGCVSQGRTEAEALDNIREAIAGCLATRAAHGMSPTIEVREVEVPA